MAADGIVCKCQTGSGYWVDTTCRPLTETEKAWAADIGRQRHERSWARGSRDSVGAKSKEEDLATHLAGTPAELAYCIFNGLKWPATVDDYDGADAPDGSEVRFRGQKGYRLILREKDIRLKGDRRFVSAYFDGRVYHFDGWAWGHEGLLFPLTDPNGKRPARFIPVERLHRLPFYERPASGRFAMHVPDKVAQP